MKRNKVMTLMTSSAFKQTLEIASAITVSDGGSVGAYISLAVESHLPEITPNDCRSSRRTSKNLERVTTNLVSDAQNERLTAIAKSWGKTKTSVVVACIRKQLMIELSRWGCQTPTEFLTLMRSPAPLRVLERRKEREKLDIEQ